MLIDLHCHTRKVKNGDGDKREVSDELFAEKIRGSRVEIAAITNHNLFDDVQFLRLQRLVETDCKLWPGVELDVCSGENRKRYHLLVVCNPKNVTEFKGVVASIINGATPEDFLGDIVDIVAKFDPLDCLFLPHFHKSPAITDGEFKKLESLLSNKNRLIAETTNVRSMGIFASHNINSIAGSDVKDWVNYPRTELPELRLRVEGYEHFCKLLDRDYSAVKTLLDKNTPSVYDVYPCSGNHDIKESHRFYKEINVIFGDKGTGKTEVIKSLVSKFKSEDVPFSKYISSETKDDLDELLDVSDMDRSAESLGLEECESEFSLIAGWGDKTPTPISEYKEFYRTYSAKENQKRIGWSRSSDISDDVEVRLEKINNDLMSISVNL